MSLRCKVGDLAVYVGIDARCFGATTQCVKHLGLGRGEVTGEIVQVWLVEPPVGGAVHVADCALRPITPPADSVSDSEVRKLYEPTKTKEPA